MDSGWDGSRRQASVRSQLTDSQTRDVSTNPRTRRRLPVTRTSAVVRNVTSHLCATAVVSRLSTSRWKSTRQNLRVATTVSRRWLSSQLHASTPPDFFVGSHRRFAIFCSPACHSGLRSLRFWKMSRMCRIPTVTSEKRKEGKKNVREGHNTMAASAVRTVRMVGPARWCTSVSRLQWYHACVIWFTLVSLNHAHAHAHTHRAVLSSPFTTQI